MSHQPKNRDHLFREGWISVGLVLPIRATDTTDIGFREQVDLAALADQLGFAAVWVRDVPLNGSWYFEAFGHPDPGVAFELRPPAQSTIPKLAVGSGWATYHRPLDAQRDRHAMWRTAVAPQADNSAASAWRCASSCKMIRRPLPKTSRLATTSARAD